MPTSFDTLIHDALALPADQRVSLAHRLLSSLDPEPDPDAEKAWEEEIARRIALSDAGEMEVIPAHEVFARLKRIAPDRS